MSNSETERFKILIAEDSAATRSQLSGLLKSWDYDVCEAADGAEAWEEFNRETFRIVLTDWQMPEVDGIELIRRIRAKENTGFVYTVLLTARSATSDLILAMEDGADAYLVKPTDPAELRARIQAGARILKLEQKLERRRQQLLEARTQILDAEKLAGIGQLAAGMAHEINNPIAVVSGNLDVFAQGVTALLELLDLWEKSSEIVEDADSELTAQIQQLASLHDLPWLRKSLPGFLDSTRTHVQRVRDIIGRLQDFSWHDKAGTDRIDPVQAVQTTIEVLSSELARAQVKIRTAFQSVAPLTCHPAQFNQAIYNVLHNAIQASSPNDTVDVAILTSDGSVVIQISDRGPGIPEQDRSRVFQPFFTTRHVGSGTGLGLSYSHRIFQEAGGSIRCSSRDEGGTVFHIQIPIAASEKSTDS